MSHVDVRRQTATAPAPSGRTTDPTLGFAVRLLLGAAPLVVLVALTHSRLLLVLVGGVVAVAVLAAFPGPTAARLTGVVLVLAPDAVVVAHLGSSPVSLREVAFCWWYAVVALAVVRGRLRMRVPAPFLLTVLLVAALVGALQNQRPKSLLEFGVLVLLPPVAGATLATDRETALDFLRGMTVGTLVLIGVAFVEKATNHNFLVTSTALGSFVRVGHVRANAGWDYPTMLSAFLCLAGFFVLEVLRVRWGMLGIVAGGALVTAGVITTQSRSGLLGLAAGALTYLLLQRRASQGLRVIVAVVVAVGALLVLPGAAPASFRTYVSQSLTSGSSAHANVAYRQQLYTAAGRALSHHPLFGYGYGSGKSIATNALRTYFGNLTDLASLPVSLAVQLGYVGASAVGLFLLTVVVRLARTKDVPARLPIAAGLVACTVAMLGVPVSPPFSWMLLLAGVAWSFLRERSRSDAVAAGPVPAAPATTEPGATPGPTFHVSRFGGVRRT